MKGINMFKTKKLLLIALFILIFLATILAVIARPYLKTIYYHSQGQRTITDIINLTHDNVHKNLKPYFDKSNISFPPEKITFVSFKQEEKMELWVSENDEWIYVKAYPILGLSGESGPKLKEGDRQVPEGVYNIIGLNPNSYFHLAMLIDYPNKYDKKNAKNDNRTNLGGDICIHGSNVSAGCLAMGDDAIEELFYIVVKAGIDNTKVIIAPYDFRKDNNQIELENINIEWLPELYSIIDEELNDYVH
ncbi:L,D-transpeptidase family protein [Herbivorax sp. ANBcel31]|uniref:L,D-transpeptidase family protein n=1 Tax=Herbivorax sp. ANBcel31 TaxID=3069754 RepID=UPI0027B4F5A9|nr:L,D-transpeptidase family protein [Herbivorax sp. ANBcel31]MDQ2088021.1 L,D-transpeptidase family protein [Herbivorax sp. ANBcel31]